MKLLGRLFFLINPDNLVDFPGSGIPTMKSSLSHWRILRNVFFSIIIIIPPNLAKSIISQKDILRYRNAWMEISVLFLGDKTHITKYILFSNSAGGNLPKWKDPHYMNSS